MKTHPRTRTTKPEDVPAPTRKQFEGFIKALVSVPKEELDRREAAYQRKRLKQKG